VSAANDAVKLAWIKLRLLVVSDEMFVSSNSVRELHIDDEARNDIVVTLDNENATVEDLLSHNDIAIINTVE